VVEIMQADNYSLGNADITIAAQKPKLAGYLTKMEANIAEDLNASTNHVNVKATTTEKLGFVGREEGISCCAVVLLNHHDY